MSLTTTTLNPSAGALVDSGATLAPAVTWAIGGNVAPNGNHALLRFDTSTTLVNDTDEIKEAKLGIKYSVSNTPTVAFEVWGAVFGAALTFGDYGGVENNKAPVTDTTYRCKIGQITPSGIAVTAGNTAELHIPQFMIPANTTSWFADFQIRPAGTTNPGATGVITIHSNTAVSNADKPYLTLLWGTIQDLRDPSSGFRTLQTGADGFMAIGIESSPGIAVKPDIIVDVIDSNIDPVPTNIPSPARNRRRIYPGKTGVGRVFSGGSATISITPEQWVKLLLTQYKLESTTNVGPIDGVTTYEHVFKVKKASDTKTLTILQKRGDFYYLHAGCRVGNMSWTSQQNSAIVLGFDVRAKITYMYDENSAGGATLPYILSATATEDTEENSFYTQLNTYMEIDSDDSQSECIQTISLNIGQGIGEKMGHSRSRHTQGHYIGGVQGGIGLDMYFENEEMLFLALGYTRNEFPLTSRKKIKYQAMKMIMTGSRYSNENIQRIEIDMPNVSILSAQPTNPAEDAIMIQLSGAANYDTGTGTNATLTIRNSHPASFFNPSTDLATAIPREY